MSTGRARTRRVNLKTGKFYLIPDEAVVRKGEKRSGRAGDEVCARRRGHLLFTSKLNSLGPAAVTSAVKVLSVL